ncbi:TatD family hydrolase [Desulfurispirillum indicum]|uniref:Hydrolase, TatD family n=1 Tax=Desulfurispirillum indicum (strain ATCC BAA-1389 / DSM 22839 / S5) TaxID=653733 RepID=E6W0X4_DESIS|nr:TatD family hydrolase [Desulfurispirillum indicum]ADU65306.1 hydrolase, TatD family [Desulfurispirillum indicum S5]UCZ57203.1 TatD family hydrolase [Desulfurispirillum indicum]
MQLVDIHTHLALKDYAYGASVDERIKRARSNGVGRIITVGTDDEDNFTNRNLCETYPEVFMSVGIHPSESQDAKAVERSLQSFSELVRYPRTVAIGETGLDYYWTRDFIKDQQESFHHHLQLAQQHDLPVMVHSRDAFEDTAAILRQYSCRGVIHCFTGTCQEAATYLDMGYLISLPGIVSFPKATAMHEVARFLPADRLLCETDAPYLAPVPQRGKENESALVLHVYEAVARLRGVEVEELAQQIWGNAEGLFRFEKRSNFQ